MRTIITLFSLSFLLFAFSANSAAPDEVVDIYRKSLRSGINYYILAADRGRGGGLTLVASPNHTCPVYVAQATGYLKRDLPLSFSPVNPKKGIIRESTDLNIKFSTAQTCSKSSVWRLDYDKSIKQHFVTTTGVEGNPGIETIDNWFKIEKYKAGYKLVFCPTVCKYCKVICRDVGLFVDKHGTRRLALSDVPFNVIFRKA